MTETKKESSAKAILLPTLVLFLIAGVAALLLGFVNDMTKPVIARRETEETAAAMRAVLAAADSFSEARHAADGTLYYVAYGADGNVCGYVFTTHGNGYGGDITVMTGIDASGAVTGIEFLSIDETPGMGMKAQNEPFRSQFLGKTGRLTASKTAASDTEIQAITGATITSNAVTKAVNDALACFAQIDGEG
ncbi:MAG: RnfABCDGE type electron transport complex subunit G [Clostridia bacterium]|nr:RnfABCDGE type electron transport complex subunit G [Clostridia bacterium]